LFQLASASGQGGRSGILHFRLAIMGGIEYGERVEMDRHPRVQHGN
jgi:hypothetical protein